MSARRDRHGRARRPDGDPRRRPSDGYRVRDARRFRNVAQDAITALPERFAAPLAGVEIVVADVPPPPAAGPDEDVMLASFEQHRLTLFRRAIEGRADSRSTLEETLMLAIARAVARRLGFDDDIDDLLD